MAIEDTINQAAEKLIHAIEAYGPQATQLVLETGRISALNNVVSSALTLLTAIVLGVICYKVFNYSYKAMDEASKDEGWIAVLIFSGFGGCGCIVFGAVNLVFLFDIWSWVGMFHPDIYLAHKMLKI